MNNTVGMVLLHGAGLGSWIWNETESFLKNPVLALDFPGRNNSSGDNQSLTLDNYCEHLLEEIQTWKHSKIILVAHSISGVVALRLAEKIDDRIVGFIGVCASIPKNGRSFISTLPFLKRVVMHFLLRIAGTKPPKAAIKKSLCNDLTLDQAEKVAQKFIPESIHLYFDQCNAAVPNTNKLYIKTNNDQELSGSMQDKMVSNLGAHQVSTLEAGHLPMIGSPEKLAAILNQFSAKCDV